MRVARLNTIGARRPTGTTMSPGRRAGLGGARKEAHAARVQFVLPIYGQLGGIGRFEPGSFSADLQDAGKLQAGVWGVSDVADERDAQFAGGSLPANAAGPDYGFDRRRDAGAGRETFLGTDAGQAGTRGRIERAIAARAGSAVAGFARGGDLARLAGIGVQRNSSCAASAGRHGKIENQPGANRTGAHPGGNGIEAGELATGSWRKI